MLIQTKNIQEKKKRKSGNREIITDMKIVSCAEMITYGNLQCILLTSMLRERQREIKLRDPHIEIKTNRETGEGEKTE